MRSLELVGKKSHFERYQIYYLVIIAVVFIQIPILSVPLNWLETYFHELSHGIAALVSGGEIVKIQLFTNGAGMCATRGGSALLISFSGYFGATLWGFTLYKIAQLHNKISHYLTICLAVLLTITILLWVRDILSVVIIAVLIALFIVSSKVNHSKILQLLIQFFAVTVLINSLKSPLYLIDGKPFGDGAALAKISGVPEIIWVVIWSSIALSALYFLGKKHEKTT